LADLINIHHIGQGKYEVAYRGTIGHQGLAMLVVWRLDRPSCAFRQARWPIVDALVIDPRA